LKFVVLVLVALLAAAPSAAAQDRASAYERWLSIRDAATVSSGWTGSVAGCAAGSEAPESVAATLRAVNEVRAFAGLAPVTFDDGLNATARVAALSVLDARCAVAEDAGRSLLASGRSGADAILSYAAALPHRLVLLDRTASVFGTGSLGGAHALLFASGVRAPASGPGVVAWPPAGWVPSALLPAEWSAEFPVGTDVTGVTVSVDGVPRTVDARVVHDGYAGPALVWPLALSAGDHVVDVVAGGHAYRVNTFLADVPQPVGGVRATRTGNRVTLTWAPAGERGVPVTGYRVRVAGHPDVTVPAGTHSLTFEIDAAGMTVAVVPLSRAGSPRVTSTAFNWTSAGGEGVPAGGGDADGGSGAGAGDGGAGAAGGGGAGAAGGVVVGAGGAGGALGGGVTANSRAPAFTRTVRIVGPRRPGPGSRLVADVHVRDAAKIRYQWLRDGRAIRGETRRTYTVRRGDRRRALRVRVTAVGSTTITRTTAAVRIRT
jgi:hypothetical protein